MRPIDGIGAIAYRVALRDTLLAEELTLRESRRIKTAPVMARASPIQGRQRATVPGRPTPPMRPPAEDPALRSAGRLIEAHDRLGIFTSAQMRKVRAALTHCRASARGGATSRGWCCGQFVQRSGGICRNDTVPTRKLNGVSTSTFSILEPEAVGLQSAQRGHGRHE
jgi:hypothetical protein